MTLVVSFSACNASQSGRSATRPSTLSASTASLDPAKPKSFSVAEVRRLWTQMVAAGATGDIATAMRLRCAASRRSVTESTLFAEQARRLIHDVGQPSLLAVESVRTDMAVPSGLADAHAYRVTLRYRNGVQGTIDSFVGVEDGELKICGASPSAASSIEVKKLVPSDAGNTTVELRDLMPPVPAGSRRISDEPFTPRSGPRPLATWTRAWARGSYGGARISARRYGTASEAAAAAQTLASEAIGDATGTFAIQGLSHASGFRIVGFGWLLFQVGETGPYVDSVLLQYGATLVVIGVSGLATDADYDAVETIANAVNDRVL